jgi:hypothetical protein
MPLVMRLDTGFSPLRPVFNPNVGFVVHKIKQRQISFSSSHFTACFISVIYHPQLRVKYQGLSHPTRRLKIKGFILEFI